ncbi:MAG: hypothetical protein JWQ18_2741 [Conexibacter sp.]|nr:hypothetical protein [Conexibacter sp.]
MSIRKVATALEAEGFTAPGGRPLQPKVLWSRVSLTSPPPQARRQRA